MRPVHSSIYNIFDPKGLKFLTCLRLGFSYQNLHRLRQNILCSCSLKTEDKSLFLMHWHHFLNHRFDLMNSVKSVCDNFESISDNVKKNLLLCSDSRFDEFKTRFILDATITYIKNCERFFGSLFG